MLLKTEGEAASASTEESHVGTDDDDVNVGVTVEGGPKAWRRVLEAIQTMRQHRDAPVDTMGCERLADDLSTPKVMTFLTRLTPTHPPSRLSGIYNIDDV